MDVLILAAGYGTRLYPLTKDRPKALLPVRGRPLLDYLIADIDKREDIEDIYIVSNHRFSSQFVQWLNESKWQHSLFIIDDGTECEEERLGAIRDIKFAIEQEDIYTNLLVLGADNFFEQGIAGFIDFSLVHIDNVCIGLYDIEDRSQASKFGVVELDARSIIVDFFEKPKSPQTSLVAVCLYYFPNKKLSLILDYVQEEDKRLELDMHKLDAPGNYINWLIEKDYVYGYVFQERWFDIGSIEDYNRLQNTRPQMRA